MKIKSRKRSALIIAFFAIILITPLHKIYACGCPLPPSPIHAYLLYGKIFAGRVININSPELIEIGLTKYNLSRVSFDVSKSYRGFIGKNSKVITSPSGASCGYDFEEGKEYLVYGHRARNGDIAVSLCSNTKLLSKSENEVKLFNTLSYVKIILSFLLIAIIVFIIYRSIIRHIRKKHS